MSLFKITNVFFLSCILLATSAFSAPLDFDGDNVSEFVLVTINNDSNLTWNIYKKDGSLIETVSSFGSNGNHLAPAPWVTKTALLAVLQNSSSKIQWKIRRNAADYEFFDVGSSKDYLISGGDFDGDTYNDAANIEIRGNSLYWRVHFSPLSKSTSKLSRFGRKTDKPFFVNFDGSKDYAAILRNGNKILIRNIKTRTTNSINLPSTFSSVPIPVRQKSGKDIFAFIESGSTDTTITSINLSGAVIKQTTISGNGIAIVGEYMKNKSGEEIAIQTDSGFTIVNPVTGTAQSITLPSGIPVDEVNINIFESLPDSCNDENRNPSDGNEGFLWKPASDSTGKLAIHTPKTLAGKISYVEVVSPSAVSLESGVYGGNGNGGRDLFRFSKPGGSYPDNSSAVVHLSAGCKITYVIPDTSRRWD